MSKIIQVVILLARQGVPFSGNFENIDSSNRGNFKELIHFKAKTYSIDLNKFITHNQNANYLSPEIQNEIPTICNSIIKEKILNEIRQSKYFSIIVDGTTDISRKEQVSFCVRFCNEKLEIKEKFLGFYETEKTSGESLLEL